MFPGVLIPQSIRAFLMHPKHKEAIATAAEVPTAASINWMKAYDYGEAILHHE